jgi:hypothetical protein
MQLVSAVTIGKTGASRKMSKQTNLESSVSLLEFNTWDSTQGLTVIN